MGKIRIFKNHNKNENRVAIKQLSKKESSYKLLITVLQKKVRNYCQNKIWFKILKNAQSINMRMNCFDLLMFIDKQILKKTMTLLISNIMIKKALKKHKILFNFVI